MFEKSAPIVSEQSAELVHPIYCDVLPENLEEFKLLMGGFKIKKKSKLNASGFLTISAPSLFSSLTFTMLIILSIFWINYFTSNINIPTLAWIGMFMAVFTGFVTATVFTVTSMDSRTTSNFNNLYVHRKEFLQSEPKFDKILALYTLQPENYDTLNSIYIDETFSYYDRLEEYRKNNGEYARFKRELELLNRELEKENFKNIYGL